jgi:hypothetical protein
VADDTCSVSQFDGLTAGGKAQESFLVVAECGKGAKDHAKILLVKGHFPVRSSAAAADYQVLDHVEVQIPPHASIDLASGACFGNGQPIQETIGVLASWEHRERVSHGGGLYAIISATPSHSKLQVLDNISIASIYCVRDEP